MSVYSSVTSRLKGWEAPPRAQGIWKDVEKKGEALSLTSLGMNHPRKAIRVIWTVLMEQMFAPHLLHARHSPNTGEETRQDPWGPLDPH